MIDIFDSETIIKIYRLLGKKCDAIDKFIENNAIYFGPCSEEYGAFDVCNNIIDLMTRKNRLINLKIIIDRAVNSLKDKDKKILYLKMNYSLSIENLCSILELKERTAFRRLEHAFASLTEAINSSPYVDKVSSIILDEEWIKRTKEDVRDRRLAFRVNKENISSL